MFVARSVCTALLIVLLPPSALSSQYVPADVQSVVIRAYVEEFETLVTLRAELADRKLSNELLRLVISYADTEVRIPEKILGEAPNPRLEELSLAYCGRGGLILELEDGSIERPERSKHPCLLVFLKYGEPYEIADDHFEYPYLSIDVFEGEVVGCDSWYHDGSDWESRECELENW